MENQDILAFLFPHPPIIVAEVGRTEALKAEKTINSAQSLSKKILDFNPETIIIITPHSYFNTRYFSVYTDTKLSGSFDNFGAPEVKITYNNDIEFIERLNDNVKERFKGLNALPESTPLDHGSMVPLYFFHKAGYRGKISVINYTALSKEDHILFGEIIAKTVHELNRKTVLVASGDLSHKLKPSAPAGYNPKAYLFDEAILDSINKGNYEAIINLNQDLIERAGECGYNSLMVGMGVAGKIPQNNEVLSYEAPFGVGYMVAIL